MVKVNNSTEAQSLRIIPEVLHFIASEALRSHDGLETGGILLGTDDNQAIVIHHAGGPGPKALRESHRFLRDLAHAQQLAEWAWMEDRSQWIGEWHTHPSGDLTPSCYDLDAYTRHLHDPELGFSRFISIIVGLSPTGQVMLVPWVIDRESARPIPTVLVDDTEDASLPESQAGR